MSVRPIAQQDPVENLTRQYGAETQMARKHLDYLVNCLRSMDGLAEKLAEHGITVDADIGPIGNAAAAARRDLERETGRPTFSFPKPR